MPNLFSNPEFWAALVKLAWPAVFLWLMVMFRPAILALARRENLTMKVAGMEISVSEVAKKSGEDLVKLQERVAKIESSFEGGEAPVADSDFSRNVRVCPERSSKQILWVDDYPSNNAFGIERLEEKGVNVRKELSTAAALHALSQEKFDLIITDLGRVEGGVDNPFAGLDLIEMARAQGVETQIVVFAGRRGEENADKLFEAGADFVTSSMVDLMKIVQHTFPYVDDRPA